MIMCSLSVSSHTQCSVRCACTVKAGNLGMEMSISVTSQESDSATVAGFLLSPLVQLLCGLSAKREPWVCFSATISAEPALCSTSLPHPLLACVVWGNLGMLTPSHPGTSNHVSHYNFCTVRTVSITFHFCLFLPPALFFPTILLRYLFMIKTEVNVSEGWELFWMSRFQKNCLKLLPLDHENSLDVTGDVTNTENSFCMFI